jgi:hypothetical protein
LKKEYGDPSEYKESYRSNSNFVTPRLRYLNIQKNL